MTQQANIILLPVWKFNRLLTVGSNPVLQNDLFDKGPLLAVAYFPITDLNYTNVTSILAVAYRDSITFIGTVTFLI